MSNNKNVDKLVLKMIVLLVLSVSEVLGYYCDHNYCSAEEFCCGDNLCCDYTNSVLFYSVIIIIAIVITIFILWAFFRIFFFYNNSFFIHFAKKFGHLFFSTDINNQIDHKWFEDTESSLLQNELHSNSSTGKDTKSFTSCTKHI